jgi:hypothetical protein
VSYPIGPDRQPRPVERQEPLGTRLPVEPTPPTIVLSPPELPMTMEHVSIAPFTPTEHHPDLAAGPRPTEPVPTPAPPSAAESWPLRVFGLARSWIPSIWLAGVLVLTARLILASLALDRLVRRACDAPDDIARECREIAEHLGCLQTVRVVRSADVVTPCLAGLLNPVLLLPERESQGPETCPASWRTSWPTRAITTSSGTSRHISLPSSSGSTHWPGASGRPTRRPATP